MYLFYVHLLPAYHLSPPGVISSVPYMVWGKQFQAEAQSEPQIPEAGLWRLEIRKTLVEGSVWPV